MADEMTKGERHELECLRARVKQIAYPCSPLCDGYLRELALRNEIAENETASTPGGLR